MSLANPKQAAAGPPFLASRSAMTCNILTWNLARLWPRANREIAATQSNRLGHPYPEKRRVSDRDSGRLHAEVHGGMETNENGCPHSSTGKNGVSPTSKHTLEALQNQQQDR